MIRVDLAEIEKLTDILVKSASDSDEVLSRLRQISNEMLDDIELPLYPQSTIALEAISVAFDALNRGNDTLQSLKNVILTVESTYQENEQKNRDALNRMTTLLNNINVEYNAAIVSNNIVHMEHSDTIASQSKVQQLVAESVEEMQATNIAAVTKTVRKEYDISAVEDLKDNG